MFYVGQKVVCVDTKSRYYNGQTNFSHIYGEVVKIGTDLNGLKEGEVYTIIGLDVTHDGTQGVHLREINRPLGPLGKKIPYKSKRFRPLVEKKTDISIFTEMLNKKPEHRKVRCSASGEAVEALEKA